MFLTRNDCSGRPRLQKTFVLQRLRYDSSPGWPGWPGLTPGTQSAVDFPETFHDGVPVVPVADHGYQEEGEKHGDAADVEEVIVVDVFD